MATATNVLFKRGPQANVPLSSATDGVFYLTEDTHRLYVGQGTQAVLLNQTVEILANVDALTTATAAWTTDAIKAAHVKDFVYLQQENILATYINSTTAGYTWQQINPDTDTQITGVEFSIATNSNTSNVYEVITTQQGDKSPVSYTANFSIVGQGISCT